MADNPRKFDEAEKELEQYGSWIKASPDDYLSVAEHGESDLMTEEEELLLGELESSESDSESSFGDIHFDEFGDLDDEEDDTFGMEEPEDMTETRDNRKSDLSVKILQSIENELVGLRNEVKDLKKELSILQKTAPENATPPAVETEVPVSGFFEEDDDETIALTGDELDNILVNAETAFQDEMPDLDEIILNDDEDEQPEEFNESNLLDEDELQDTDDLLGDTELDLDSLSLGEEDPALAELTESEDDFTIDDDFGGDEELIISDDMPDEFDLHEIPDLNDEDFSPFASGSGSSSDSESFEIDGESFTVEEFEGADGESFVVEEYTGDEPPSVPEAEEEEDSPVIENPVEEEFIQEDEETGFDEGEEVDLTFEEDIPAPPAEAKTQSVPFEDLEEIDLSSFDENLVEEEKDDFEHIDLDTFIEDDEDEDELTVDIEPDLSLEGTGFEDEIEEPELDLPDLDEVSLDEMEDTVPVVDDILFEEDDTEDILEDIELPDLNEIVLEDNGQDDSEEEVFTLNLPDEDFSFDSLEIPGEEDAFDEIVLESDENEFQLPEEDLTLDEIMVDEDEISDEIIPEDDIPETDEIMLEDEEPELQLPDEDITLDEIILDDEEPELELPDEDISLDEIILDDEEQELELSDEEISLDEIVLEDEEREMEFPDEEITLDEISLEDDSVIEIPDEMIGTFMSDDISLDEVELPDLEEIILDDSDDELPDLDEILAESGNSSESLEEIELPDLDDESVEDSDLFGGEAEDVDLDSLEQMAIEEEADDFGDDFSSQLADRVEEIRDAAMQGNIPEELRDEIKDILLYMDQLLESLPDEKIQEFARSEHFEVYKKIFEELGIKK